MNIAFQQGNQAVGMSGCTLAGQPFITDGATIFAAAYDPSASRTFTTSPATTVTTAAPGLYQYSQAGITKMYFPSKSMGVAVGMTIGGTLAGLPNNPVGWPNVGGTFCNTPTILLSFDAATTWVWATATPTFTLTAAANVYSSTPGLETVSYPVRILETVLLRLSCTNAGCQALY